jgi:hypothetical protein
VARADRRPRLAVRACRACDVVGRAGQRRADPREPDRDAQRGRDVVDAEVVLADLAIVGQAGQRVQRDLVLGGQRLGLRARGSALAGRSAPRRVRPGAAARAP